MKTVEQKSSADFGCKNERQAESQSFRLSTVELVHCYFRRRSLALCVGWLLVGRRQRYVDPNKPAEVPDIGAHSAEAFAAFPEAIVGRSGELERLTVEARRKLTRF